MTPRVGCRLGHGSTANEMRPRRVAGLLANQRVVQASAGGTHTAAVTSDGRLYTFGGGHTLGHGSVQIQLSPRLVEALAGKRVLQSAASNSSTAAVSSTGQLFTWGIRRLGDSDEDNSAVELVPRLVQALVHCRVVQVAVGDTHTAAVTSAGGLWTWGCGGFGRYATLSSGQPSVLMQWLTGWDTEVMPTSLCQSWCRHLHISAWCKWQWALLTPWL